MSTQRKAFCAMTLLILALFLIVGAAIMSTHVALGVFLTTAALMLGPFAGLALHWTYRTWNPASSLTGS